MTDKLETEYFKVDLTDKSYAEVHKSIKALQDRVDDFYNACDPDGIDGQDHGYDYNTKDLELCVQICIEYLQDRYPEIDADTMTE